MISSLGVGTNNKGFYDQTQRVESKSLHMNSLDLIKSEALVSINDKGKKVADL